MTQDEIDIETYRYRAPAVVPLGGFRLAVLTPGWDPPWRIFNLDDPKDDQTDVLCAVLTEYVEWNVLPEARHLPKEHPNTLDKLASLGLTDAEMDIALSALITKRKGTSA